MNASFWSFCGMGPYVIAIPYTTDSSTTGPYVWSNQGASTPGNTFVQPVNAPGGRVGAIVGQFLMLGDIFEQQTEVVAVGNGVKTAFNSSLTHTPMLAQGSVYDQAGKFSGTFQDGLITGSGSLNAQNLPGPLSQLFDAYTNGTTYFDSGFSFTTPNDPGRFAFATLTINGVTVTTTTLFSYVYSAGLARWTWTGGSGIPAGGFGFGGGVHYTATFDAASGFGTAILSGSVNIASGGGFTNYRGYLSNGVGSLDTTLLSTINYTSGAISVNLSAPLPNNDTIYAKYTQAAPYRVQWCAIGDPTNWPIPLTASAVAFQSGYEDLEVDLGAVKFIAGYPLYGVIFQEFGITRANYVGGNVVFSFSVFSRNRGLVAKGAACVVAGLIYFLSQDGFFVTDGNSSTPIGTDADNETGIDNWFWDNVNTSALESITAGYDSETRSVFFAIPTGTDTAPDTLLTFNPLSARWTKSAIATQVIWTDTQPGNMTQLGMIDQVNQYNSLSGPTLNGYLESLDLMDADGNLRFAVGIRPNVTSADTPQAVVGVRNSLQDAVNYSDSNPPDPFSRIVSVLASGLYTRVRVSSAAATNLKGATLYQQPGGPV